MESLLKQQPPLLFLGSRPGLIRVFRTLNQDLDIEPCLLADKRPVSFPGFPRFRFVRLGLPHNTHYVLYTLRSIAYDEEPNRTSILVPCTLEFNELVKRNLYEIEAEFIVLPYERLLGMLPTPDETKVFS